MCEIYPYVAQNTLTFMPKIFKTTMICTTGSSSWWSSNQQDADEMLALYVNDAMFLTGRDKTQATVECTVWSGVENVTLVELLNGFWARWCWMRVTVDSGHVIEYASQLEKDVSVMEPCMVEITGPTPEYAERYQWLLENPALYMLCLRAHHLITWRKALSRVGISLPSAISKWLYDTVHRQHGCSKTQQRISSE